ncbi:MAG: beta-ketoacyl-ACP synthase II [Elusimicrobia bacterium]|nr:beta-ketoacyl-ACP synthase II [Candidatus Liberimonas magnetica]
MKKRVVITGIGIVSPIGNDKETYAAALRQGKSGAGQIVGFDSSEFSTHIAAEVKDFNPEEFIEKKRIRRMAKFVQFGMAAASMAVSDSGLDLAKEDMSSIGVITGSGMGGLDVIEEQHTILLEKGPRRVSPFLIPMIITNILPGEISIKFGFTGPNYAVTSACASSNHAIGDSFRLLTYGDAEVMVCGGAEAAVTPIGLAGFCSIKALSTRNDDPLTASRPFDKDRDGFLMAEGGAIVVLETLEHALARNAHIYAELIGYGASDDAYHITAPHEQGMGAIQAMNMAIKDAGITSGDIDYINAHGTSTEFNDKIETLAIKKVFGERAKSIPVTSTKSMIGHMLGAAGAAELVATILCMEKGFIHPTINYKTPDPECDLDYVPNVAREQQINCALSNSLGFGGHNAVIIIKRYNG